MSSASCAKNTAPTRLTATQKNQAHAELGCNHEIIDQSSTISI
jgi:hypothetical protein